MTDEMLMKAVKDGDLQQASLLFERYNKRIFNFLAYMAGDRVLAEDLTQNVFLRVIRYRNSYRDGARFEGWIFQISRNVLADHYQGQKRQRSQFIDVENMSDTLSDNTDAAEQDEKEHLLQRAMSRLTEEQRQLLVLTRFQHRKYEEVAQIMNTTVANIKVKVHRAIGQLREHYFTLEKI
jgi:RNA polymerase sigma factor (sigma-70 family)